jgi:tRNA(fMet)-specific endonuclease VapC
VGRRLILDPNVLIAYERGTIDRDALDSDELAIGAVSVAEYRVGIEMADSPERAADRARALVAIMSAAAQPRSDRLLAWV